MAHTPHMRTYLAFTLIYSILSASQLEYTHDEEDPFEGLGSCT